MHGDIVTVDAAIKRGRWQLMYQPIMVFVVLMVIYCVLFSFIENNTIWVAVYGFAGFAAICVLPMIYYFALLPRWRIWAFSNVRNVHELKQRAILAQIYPKDGSYLWRFEMTRSQQKMELANLEYKFLIKDEFIDDPAIPFETTYAYGTGLSVWYAIMTASAVVGGVVLLMMGEYLAGAVILVFGIPLVVLTYKRFTTTGPMLVISNDGITTKENGFSPWPQIQQE